MASLLPCSSSTLLSQAQNDSSVMISSLYKLSKYDLMKPVWVKKNMLIKRKKEDTSVRRNEIRDKKFRRKPRGLKFRAPNTCISLKWGRVGHRALVWLRRSDSICCLPRAAYKISLHQLQWERKREPWV